MNEKKEPPIAYSSSSSSSSSPSAASFICNLTSFHNLPLLWFSYHLVTTVSKEAWKTNAEARTVPTKTEFLLNRTLYTDEKDYCEKVLVIENILKC